MLGTSSLRDGSASPRGCREVSYKQMTSLVKSLKKDASMIKNFESVVGDPKSLAKKMTMDTASRIKLHNDMKENKTYQKYKTSLQKPKIRDCIVSNLEKTGKCYLSSESLLEPANDTYYQVQARPITPSLPPPVIYKKNYCMTSDDNGKLHVWQKEISNNEKFYRTITNSLTNSECLSMSKPPRGEDHNHSRLGSKGADFEAEPRDIFENWESMKHKG